ncbi:MAG: CAP domain-containing protein [Methylococcaceae bacterium]
MKTGLTIFILSVLPNAYAAADFTAGEQTEIVTVHNNWRSQVKTPELKWSSTIASTAQNHADELKTTHACKLKHSERMDLGENLFWASPLYYSNSVSEVQTITPTQVFNSWGSEKVDYDYLTNTCATGKVCGHYTQIVWKSTTEIGCGKAVCPDNSQIWVCNYKPAGNIVDQQPY